MTGRAMTINGRDWPAGLLVGVARHHSRVMHRVDEVVLTLCNASDRDPLTRCGVRIPATVALTAEMVNALTLPRPCSRCFPGGAR